MAEAERARALVRALRRAVRREPARLPTESPKDAVAARGSGRLQGAVRRQPLSQREGSGEQFTEQDEETLERFAVQASIVIDNAISTAALNGRIGSCWRCTARGWTSPRSRQRDGQQRMHRRVIRRKAVGARVFADVGQPQQLPFTEHDAEKSLSDRRGPMRARSSADTPEVMNA